MQKRKSHTSSTFSKTLFKFILLIPTFYSLVGKIFSLVSYETDLAGKSLVKIIILAIFGSIVLTSTWLGLLAMAIIYLVSLQLSYLSAFAIVTLVNFVIFIIIAIKIKKSEQNMTFPLTRLQIRRALNLRNEE